MRGVRPWVSAAAWPRSEARAANGSRCRNLIAAAATFVLLASGSVGEAQDASTQRAESGAAAPEQQTFEGRVIGPDGDAVSELAVLLHRVTNQSGAQLARSVTTEDGRFTFKYEAPSDAGGVYFVATRYDGRVYVGPMLRAPFVNAGDYEMQVGVPGVGDVEALMGRSSSTAMTGSGSPASPPPAPGALFVAVMLSAAILVGGLLVVRGTGPPSRRRMLIQLAELDEAGPSGASSSAVARRRRELLRRAREA